MNHDIKFKYDKMKESDPTSDTHSPGEDQYPRESNVRNVCFIFADGQMIFRSYSYLVGCEFFPEESKIILSFTSDTITLTGKNLKAFFLDLFSHLPKFIEETNDRYNDLEEKEKTIVNKILIEKI